MVSRLRKLLGPLQDKQHSRGTTILAMNLDGAVGRIVWNLFNRAQVTSTTFSMMVTGITSSVSSTAPVCFMWTARSTVPALRPPSRASQHRFIPRRNQDFTGIGINQASTIWQSSCQGPNVRVAGAISPYAVSTDVQRLLEPEIRKPTTAIRFSWFLLKKCGARERT